MIGRTNTPEFGLGSHTFNEVFGTTRNAYDPSRSAGGSSGGAAVALASRMLPVADGSDFMGCLRNPAGWNNVYGFRPSQGRVPFWPAQDVWVTMLGTEGPMGRTVKDVALLLDVQAGYDPRVPLSISRRERFAAGLDRAPGDGGLDPRRCRSAGSATWTATCRWSPACWTPASRACAGCRRSDARSSRRASGTRPRRSGRPGSLAPLAGGGTHRAATCDPQNRTADQARGLVGDRPGPGPERRADDAPRATQRSAFYQHMLALLQRYDFLALPSAQVWPFDADVALAHAHRRCRDGHLPPLDGGGDLRHAGRAAALGMPAGFNGAGPADGHAADRPAAGRPRGSALGRGLRNDDRRVVVPRARLGRRGAVTLRALRRGARQPPG